MNVYVLDVSVAAKWVLSESGENLTTEALRLLHDFGDGRVRFLIPDLFWLELGNVLWKGVRRGRCSETDAQNSMADMLGRAFDTLPSDSLLEQALSLAITFDRTMYDSVYLALAVQAGCDLLTADERLANAVAARLPVKWLGAI